MINRSYGRFFHAIKQKKAAFTIELTLEASEFKKQLDELFNYVELLGKSVETVSERLKTLAEIANATTKSSAEAIREFSDLADINK